MKKQFYRAGWTLLFLIATFSGATCGPAGGTGPIRIGVASPYSGDLASYGIPVKNAVILAAKAINAKGGIKGRRIELLLEDDVCEPNTATVVATKLITGEVMGVIGHLCSGATEAALGLYREAKIVVISPASTNPDLTLGGKNPHFFRTIAHDAAQAEIEVNFAVKTLQAKKIAVLHDKGTYGKGLAELVKKGFEKASLEVVLFEGVTPGAVSYSALISKIGQQAPDTVTFGGYYPEASKLISEARKKGLLAHFLSGDGVKDPAFLKIAGKYAEGYYVSAPTDVSQIPMAQSVTKAYKAEFNNDPGTFSLQGYAALLALAHAIEKASEPTFEGITKALHSQTTDTPLGAISFDKQGDVLGAGFSMYQVRDGAFQRAP